VFIKQEQAYHFQFDSAYILKLLGSISSSRAERNGGNKTNQ